MAHPPEFIEAAEKVLLHYRKDGKTAIIDVRDDDYFDGHIKGAKQVPSEKFGDEAEIDRVIKDLPNGTEVVVVHCMLSQVRGPKCAKRLAERLESSDWAGAQDKPQIKVLRNGFEGFYNQFATDAPSLIEKSEPS